MPVPEVKANWKTKAIKKAIAFRHPQEINYTSIAL